jgi:hypothetical protein
VLFLTMWELHNIAVLGWRGAIVGEHTQLATHMHTATIGVPVTICLMLQFWWCCDEHINILQAQTMRQPIGLVIEKIKTYP